MHTHKILKVAKNKDCAEILSKKLNISGILAQLLANRNLENISEAEKFLSARTDDLLDPFSFSEMEKAVKIIRKAIKDKKEIMLFGDYDVDGITSLALLNRAFKSQGADVSSYLPDRIKEGYGLSKKFVNLLKEKKVSVLITADCGTNNIDEINHLRNQGIEVIVTDHHEVSEGILPNASCLINPKLKSSNYKFRDLAGVGVAFKLAQAFSGSGLIEELDLVSLGTIADVVPLFGENRIIAKEGLKQLPETKKIGLQSLIEICGIKNRKFNSTFVGFILGPRINSSGRIANPSVSLNLLLAEEKKEADKLAKEVHEYNRKRQKIEELIMREAEMIIDKEINWKEHKMIVLAKEGWHQGVLGIVASKLADRFYRPTIVISISKDLCRGSGRSIKNFHLFEALCKCRGFLKAFGGHSHAIGLSITKDNIDEFKKMINGLACESLSLEDLLPSLDIDMEVNLADLDSKIIAELELLEPFGVGNPEPLLYTRNLRLKDEPRTLSRDTLKFWVTDGSSIQQAIAFGMSGLKQSLIEANYLDLVYTPRIDSWQGFDSVILEVKDIFFR